MAMDRRSVENDFFNWLSGQVSSVQLSNLYTVIAEIESFCTSRKIIQGHLFENTDAEAIAKVRDIVDKDLTFRYTYKKQWKIMSQAIHYYLQYVKDHTPKAEYPDIGSGEEEGKTEKPLPARDSLIDLLVNDGIPFVDFRDKSGCLWIVGGQEYKEAAERYKKYGITFHFKKDGARATDGRPAWWTSDRLEESPADAARDQAARPEREIGRAGRVRMDAAVSNTENSGKTGSADPVSSESTESSESTKSSEPTKSSESTELVESSESTEETARKNRIQYLHWMKENGFDTGKSIFYVSALKKIGDYANKRKITGENIFLLDSAAKFRPVYSALSSSASFLRWDKENQGKCVAVLNSYMACLSELEAKQISTEEKSRTENPPQNSPQNPPQDPAQNPPRIPVQNPPQKTALDAELAELLKGELFAPLREALSRQGIHSVHELREIKLWPFMNRHNLYTLVTRQTVLEKVQRLLSDLDETDASKLYCLVCAGKEYKGASAAEAYLHFCEELARRYPLRFRSLIGRPIRPGGPTALGKAETEYAMLKMTSPVVYIPRDLSVKAVLENASWLCEMCINRAAAVSMHEPVAEEASRKTIPRETAAYKAGSHEAASHEDALHKAASQKTASPEREGFAPASLPKPEAENSSRGTSSNPTPKEAEISGKDQLLLRKLENLVLEADLAGISLDDLKSRMGLTLIETRRLARLGQYLVRIKEKFYHEDAFVGWNEGADQLEEILAKLMQKNRGYVSAAQLYEYAHTNMLLFLNDNDLDDERSVYEMAQHLFEQTHYKGKTYIFTGKMHISSPSAEIGSSLDLSRKYAEDQGGIFRYSDLEDYLTGLGIKVGNLSTQLRLYTHPDFLYYEKGVLILASSMHVDDEWKETVRKALEKLFQDVGDHIALREIQPFWYDQLPWIPGGRRWTPLLLQSILRFWGEEFDARTIVAMDTQRMDTLHAMLVRNDSPIQNFGDVVVSFLMENDVSSRSFDAEELRQLLAGANLIQGGELFGNMSKALGGDERFSWDAKGDHVTILL